MPKPPRVTLSVTPPKRPAKNDTYRKQRKAIAPYVSRALLDKASAKRPSEYAKRIVREYYQALAGTADHQGLLSKPVYAVRVKDTPRRSRKQLKKLQDEQGQPDLKYINVAFIESPLGPNYTVEKPKIVWSDDEPNAVTFAGVTSRTALFDPDTILSDDDEEVRQHVRETIESLPKEKLVTYHIKCGEYELKTGSNRKEAENKVIEFRRKYDAMKPNGDFGAKHYCKWLFGVVAQSAGKQKDKFALREAKEESRKERKALIKAAKRRGETVKLGIIPKPAKGKRK